MSVGNGSRLEPDLVVRCIGQFHPGRSHLVAGKCVVEIDGPDHLNTDKYAADRVRDRALQREGFMVLRYTNDEVLGDVARILDELERFLEDRRRSSARET